ncbi:hypothetical protein C7B67_17775 [filamentous cyanobacterium Phorm 6]|nr:hypothetical protein C7B67_17775 [filamentous cyanobacterium Phorm 6]
MAIAAIVPPFVSDSAIFIALSRSKKEKGRGKKEEGRRKREEGRRKKEKGRRKKEEGKSKNIYQDLDKKWFDALLIAVRCKGLHLNRSVLHKSCLHSISYWALKLDVEKQSNNEWGVPPALNIQFKCATA